MHVYVNGAWVEGYLDQTPRPGWIPISVHRRVVLGPAAEQYFVRQPQLSMLLGYVRMLGPRRVVRKVVSRRRESVRNDAWVSVGVGTDPDGGPVHFIDPSGPNGVERLLVPAALVVAAGPASLEVTAGAFVPRAGAAWSDLATDARAELVALGGWRPETGTEAVVSSATWDEVRRLVATTPVAYEPLPAPPPPSERRERVDAPQPPVGTGEGFHLFGYGQYAKTQVIPNLGREVRLDCVHEIDPLQIGPIDDDPRITWDTSGVPREDEAIRNAVLAGYHHTHAPLAVELLDRGARHLVVEKPIASSVEQLDALLDALDRHPDARVHVAFHRRYSPFNRLVAEDLGAGPISLAATVYEVPLPVRHWYRWPIVGNAVVSNGCHWIDYFLHLNGYADVHRLAADQLASQLALSIELVNGASAVISLRHEGAPRLGVRDQCVFWSGEATAVIEDQRRYEAERGFRKLRTRTTHLYGGNEAMYREFGRRISADLPGDDRRSIEVSARATLELARLADAGT